MHFGTDGIRSKAVDFNGEFLDRVARAIVFTYGKISVFIGRDTRVSGLEIVRLLAQALNSYGAKVTLLGIVPTPTLAYLVKAHKADLGVMVSASHNPPEYNGIKIFNGNGKKLTTAEEKALDALIGTPINLPKAKVANLKELSSGKYVEWIKKIFSDKLKGLRILLDTANGATAELAPKVFKELGCKVEVINNDQDGKAINVNC
ncbi:MAG: phosphoglucosamine mutase, partial [Clostridia bacterium]|nr:phosphoglucosamine mutase [Clostridia bacterium]